LGQRRTRKESRMIDAPLPTQPEPIGMQAVEPGHKVKKSPKAPQIPGPPPAPTLSAYYGNPTPRLADWVKEIKASKVSLFSEDDVDDTRAGLAERDADLRKTLTLATMPNAPAPVRRWVNGVTQAALKEQLPGFLFDPLAPAADQIGRIAEGLNIGLHNADKPVRGRAEVLLQLALQLILKAHSEFDAGAILAALFQTLQPPGKRDVRLVSGELRRRVAEAGIKQLRELILVQAYAQDRITQAERVRREAQERGDALMATLQMERDRSKSITAKLTATQEQHEALTVEVMRLQTAIDDNRQIGGHELAAVLARTRSLLTRRLLPMLEEAAEALDIEPPVVEAVRDHIGSMQGIIKGEVTWLDESSG
jgi:hypothetical protein